MTTISVDDAIKLIFDSMTTKLDPARPGQVKRVAPIKVQGPMPAHVFFHLLNSTESLEVVA